MKKYLPICFFLCTIGTFAQKKNTTSKPLPKTIPYTINICTDSAGKKLNAKGSSILTCNHTGQKGFTVDVTWKIEGEDISFSGLRVRTMNLGKCLEKDALVFTFEDNSQLTLNSWNEPNCDGVAIFDLDGSNYKQYSGKRIVTIRFQNGRTFETYLYKIRPTQVNFFKDAATANRGKIFKLNICN